MKGSGLVTSSQAVQKVELNALYYLRRIKLAREKGQIWWKNLDGEIIARNHSRFGAIATQAVGNEL